MLDYKEEIIMDNKFDWISFYEEFANVLLEYKNKRNELFEIMTRLVSKNNKLEFLHFERDDWWGERNYEMDPLTVFSSLNRQLTNENRIELAKLFANEFHLKSNIPTDFSGIPNMNPQSSFFCGVDEIWELFDEAIKCADSEVFTKSFETAFEKAVKFSGNGLASITMGLFWIRPYTYLNLDARNREVLSNNDNGLFSVVEKLPKSLKNYTPTGVEYVFMIQEIKRLIDTGDFEFKNLPEMSHYSFMSKEKHEHPGKAVAKTLTNITQYTDYVKKLETLFLGEDALIEDEELVLYTPYTKESFLSEVFMSDESYETLITLLKRKKNIILQGAPGVGKTFAAKKLAYSIMSERDESRLDMVQFHQSYSYEDFIMGYRPDEDGFKLAHGPFYKFCKKAQDDDERDYFFIIDEINRGNLSKIFGELFMLIENDKRDDKNSIRLLYADEQFHIPSNVHIIGMMNTADRSLAMLDYALRRRFAFFEMQPAFDSEGFKAYQAQIANSKFNRLIDVVKSLNIAIKSDISLGAGFRIGHSYFIKGEKESIDDAWLNSVVNYEIIPLLEEYWFDENSKVEHWTGRLREAIL